MADAIPFLGANKELKPDAKRQDLTLPVFMEGNDFVSCWMFDEQEIARIVETGRVWVRVRAKIHPPIALYASEPISED